MKRFNQLFKKCTNYMQHGSENCSETSRFGSLSILSRQSVLTIFCLLVIGVGEVWGWSSVDFTGNPVGGWSNYVSMPETGSNTGIRYLFIYIEQDQYFKLRIDGKPGGLHKDETSYTFDDTHNGVRLYKYNEGDPTAVKYGLNTGIVRVHTDQYTGSNDLQPWVWLSRPTIHIRHNFGYGSGDDTHWSDQDMTDNNDGTYTYTGQYGYNLTYVGVTDMEYNINGSNCYKKFENTTVYGSPNAGDNCVFEYNASGYRSTDGSTSNTGTLIIRKLCSITYNANSASVTGSVPSTQTNLPAGTETTIATNTGSLGLSNYTLSGWNTAADGSGTHYDLGGSITITGDLTLYAEWKQEVNLLKGTNGTADGSSNVAIYLNATSLSAHTDATRTGYDMTGYWTAASDGTQIVDEDGSTFKHNVTGYTASDGKWNRTAAISNLYAQWSAHTYTVTLKPGLGGSGSDGSLTVDYDAEAINGDMSYSFSNSGYSLCGWYPSQESDLKVLETNGTFAASSVEGYITGGKWSNASDCELHAHWCANTYKITFDATTNGGSIINNGGTYEESSSRKIDATYGSIVSGTMPTAQKDGYHFKGWYSAASDGLQIIDADGNWQANKSGYTDGEKKWKNADNVTLYAQYSISISGLTFTPSSVLPSEEVTVTTNFSGGNPEGTYSFCYKLTTGAGIEMQVQPEFAKEGLTATFEAPGTPGTYSVEVRLYNESNHNCETVDGSIASYTTHGTTFTVEATNAVTVEYKCGSVELRPSTVVQATASQRAVSVTAPEISGLTFTGWTRGANVTRASGDNDNVNPISIYASAASTLTANYSQSGYVYFKNTLGWSHVYLYKYNNNTYWDSDGPTDYGTGAYKDSDWGSRCTDGPLEMSLVDGTDDLYAVKPTNGAPSSGQSYVFTNSPSEEDFFGANGGYIDVVRVTTNYDATNPMVVPNKDGNTSEFYSHAKYYLNYFVAPVLPDWSWTLRGAWTGDGDWTDSNQYFHFKAPKMGSLSFQTKRYFDAAGQSKDICLFDHRDWHYGVYNMDIYYNTNNPSDAIETGVNMNMHMHTNAPGYYIFTLTYMHSNNQTGGFPGKIRLAVEYPVVVGDFRLVYTPGGGAHDHPGDVIKKRPNGLDTISLYVASDKSDKIYIQSCTSVDNTSVTWGTATAATYSNSNVFTNDTITKYGPGAYNFIVQQDANGANPTIIKVEKYTGRFYVRTNCVADKWNYKDSKDAHAMTYSEYSTTNALAADKQFSHYYVKDLDNGTNIKFTVANDYSEAISDTVVNGDAAGSWADIFGDQNLNRKMNVRFTYNQKTNKVWRAYTEGPIFNEYMVLRSDGTHVFKDNAGTKGVAKDTLVFSDLGNWVYQIDAWVTLEEDEDTYYPTYVKLTSGVHNQAGTLQTQYLKGSSGTGEDGTAYTADDAVQILGGNSDQAQHMRITYDFKTDRMITSWLPIANISGNLEIDADVMLIRTHQNAGQSITFANTSSSITNVKKVYGVMQFDKTTINNPAISRYARDLFWISFPFDVQLSDVFGMGTYGTHWIIEYYDGKGRAEHGFWADSDPNWKFVLPSMRDTFKLKANEGYILALDLDELGNSSSVWTNVTTAYLYFPSSVDMNTISTASTKEFNINQTGYLCNITRDSRNIKDSYWHCIGVPSFAGASHNLTNDYTSGDVPNMPETWTAENMPFLYEWNSTSNTLSPRKTSSFTFEAMHSYLVQYGFNKITWTNIIVNSVAARVTQMPDREYNLTMLRDSVEEDHTYVRLTDDEGISQAFEFNYDLCKEQNAGKGNIWTVTTDEIPVAGNSMPKPLQTTLVPVGVKVVTGGEYTLAMPEGTNGEDVYLIDNAYGTRMNLGLMPYTVTLTAGTYEGRFTLEFGPIQETATGVENDGLSRSDELNDAIDGVRKVFVGGRLYIIRDGKVYDAAGQRIE